MPHDAAGRNAREEPVLAPILGCECIPIGASRPSGDAVLVMACLTGNVLPVFVVGHRPFDREHAAVVFGDDQIKTLAWRGGGIGHLALTRGSCHKLSMEAEYRIVPCRHKYWIEARARDGSYRRWEVFDSEDEAVQRLRTLRHEAELAQRRATELPPKAVLPAGFFRVRE